MIEPMSSSTIRGSWWTKSGKLSELLSSALVFQAFSTTAR